MRIWLINNYAPEPKYGGMQRHANFAKYLTQMGHEVTVFAGSHIHNSDIQLIEGKEKFQIVNDYPFRWVNVKTLTYGKSMKKRVVSMFQFYLNTWKAAKTLEKPDVIIGSSAHPLAPVAAIRMGKKFGCMSIAEVRDLWPESIVTYNVAKRTNPIIRLLYKLEKWIYTKADRVIFTMEGGRDYIIEQGWDLEHGGSVDLSKVYHINNGVDLEQFDRNAAEQAFADADLDDPDTIKVIYTGSIRKANYSILILPEVAKVLRAKSDLPIKILVYGKGDCLDEMVQKCKEEQITNITFKGWVSKEQIPYVLSKAAVTILNCDSNGIIQRFGGSQNKLFEYLASGKPIISGEDHKYSLIQNKNCGISRQMHSAQDVADAILQLLREPIAYAHIRAVAEEFDFKVLTEKGLELIG